MYVDDCLVSLDSTEKARLFIKDISSLCRKGEFRSNKWIDNSKEVLQAIPAEDQAKVAKDWLIGGNTSVERVLGVHWFVEDYQVGFQIQEKDKADTRRGILSIVNSIHDLLESLHLLYSVQRYCCSGFANQNWIGISKWKIFKAMFIPVIANFRAGISKNWQTL